ncbi:MAG: hypothetical protein HYX39_02540 [Bacteroidetes bacterium]|nr:hypothetical protein [Bacteroidota bacterium]
MNLFEFNALDITKKSDFVWEWGHYLTSRKTQTHNLIIFAVNDFFAQVQVELATSITTQINGITKQDIPVEYLSALNPENPFVKIFLKDNIIPVRP